MFFFSEHSVFAHSKFSSGDRLYEVKAGMV